LLVNDKKEIIGYIVYYVEEKMCHIADILFFDSEEIIDSLLSEFILYMRQRDIGSISIHYFGNKLLIKKLREFYFILYKKGRGKILIYMNDASPFSRIFLNAENWHFLEGDIDDV
jgi:hypothetical protein